ncbi:MAG: SDR family NAD(P)-dependent oxidoreductase [Holosporales bacterium]
MIIRKSTPKSTPESFGRIAITGASSGLGAALAQHYAAPGVTLSLAGRSLPKLESVAKACQAKGATVSIHNVDVRFPGTVQEWLAGEAFDLVIANAGVSGGTANAGEESDLQRRLIFQTNVEGVLHTLHAALPAMEAAGKGQLAIISSLAAFRGFAGAPAYCASKAAVKVYGEALRALYRYRGIGVTVVCPGYIKTPMTDANDFTMPLMVSAEQAAAKIAHGLARNKALIAFPRRLYGVCWLLANLPAGLIDRLLARLPRKGALAEG